MPPRPPRPPPRATTAPTAPPPGPRGPRRAPRRRARPRPRAWRPPLRPPRPPGAPGPFSGSSLGPRASAMRSVGIVRVTDLRVRGGPPGPGEAGRPGAQGRPKRPLPGIKTERPGEAFRASPRPPKGGVRPDCPCLLPTARYGTNPKMVVPAERVRLAPPRLAPALLAATSHAREPSARRREEGRAPRRGRGEGAGLSERLAAPRRPRPSSHESLQ